MNAFPQKISRKKNHFEENSNHHFTEEISKNFTETNSSYPDSKISNDHSRKKIHHSKNHTETTLKHHEITSEEKPHPKNHTHPEKVPKSAENYPHEKILTFHTEPYPPPSREKPSNEHIKSEPPLPENKPREKDTFLVPMPLKKMNPKNPPNKSMYRKSQIPESPQIPEPISLKEKSPLETFTLPIKKISPPEELTAQKHVNHHSAPHPEMTVIPPPINAKIPEKRKITQTTSSPQKKPKPNVQNSGTDIIEIFRRKQLLCAQKPVDKRKQRGVKRNRD
jgi:hypothetical protein